VGRFLSFENWSVFWPPPMSTEWFAPVAVPLATRAYDPFSLGARSLVLLPNHATAEYAPWVLAFVGEVNS
jgi:hypothetical protein